MSDLEEAVVLAAGSMTAILLQAAKICAHESRGRVGRFLRTRRAKGRFATDFEDIVKCEKRFVKYFHMPYKSFEDILRLIEPHLQPKKRTHPRDGISSKEKLAVVLEYLASGTLQKHVASAYRISKQHFGTILMDVCSAIIKALKFEIPKLTQENLKETAKTFTKCNFPNCVGAMDGKQVFLKCPGNSGNFKGVFTLNIMAVADADYRFTYLDVGAYDKQNDSCVFSRSSIGADILNEELNFPEDIKMSDATLPSMFVASDQFPLHQRIMTPYPSTLHKQPNEAVEIFNNRINRALLCAKNAFGILCSKFYCLSKKMFRCPNTAIKIIVTCFHLHNYLMRTVKLQYCPPKYWDRYDDDGSFVIGDYYKYIPENSLFFTSFNSADMNKKYKSGEDLRKIFKRFFNSDADSVMH
ncbi:uncharacterized protein LOC119685459 [Teleopsis dalmanni]|uniref:uncharacterized protein LOC119685459 n=1 Tax=Teleopsis dalmanni TaxID=139649 RepID=UPI0018CD67F9|nr:uncharacterized protein LOC119685459 [Teleopsis dalmanni]